MEIERFKYNRVFRKIHSKDQLGVELDLTKDWSDLQKQRSQKGEKVRSIGYRNEYSILQGTKGGKRKNK